MGNWIENESDLVSIGLNYFKNLYDQYDNSHCILHTKTSFSTHVRSRLFNISHVPPDLKIKKALFSIEPCKAYGIDSFPPIFYQANQDIVSTTFCEFVKMTFRKGTTCESNTNKTLISLIPKSEQHVMIGHFRPIVLCNVHYKCITKVIVSRLRYVMDDLISPYQSSFIKGRHIQDNLIVGQEVMHIIKTAKGKSRLMALKIDLQKAYDRIR